MSTCLAYSSAILCSARDGTQDLMHARHILYNWVLTPASQGVLLIRQPGPVYKKRLLTCVSMEANTSKTPPELKIKGYKMHSCHRSSRGTLVGLPHVPKGVVWWRKLKFINPEGFRGILLSCFHLDMEGTEQRAQLIGPGMPSYLLPGLAHVPSSYLFLHVVLILIMLMAAITYIWIVSCN